MKPTKSTRAPFGARPFLLSSPDVVARVIAVLGHVPVDPLRPLQVLIREHKIQRNNGQNDYYWMRVTEIAEQAWIGGRQFSPAILHEYFKANLLPDDEPKPDPAYVRDGYRKYEYAPDGERVLVASTTMLTVAGFADFVTRVEAWGASLGVEFSVDPRGQA